LFILLLQLLCVFLALAKPLILCCHLGLKDHQLGLEAIDLSFQCKDFLGIPYLSLTRIIGFKQTASGLLSLRCHSSQNCPTLCLRVFQYSRYILIFLIFVGTL
jgi:hypothetical protein